MLHNKCRKSKGENFFNLLFLLQEMMHPGYPCPTASKTEDTETTNTDYHRNSSQPSCG